MPNRHFTNVNGYRYGFNGKEKDDEGLGGGGSTYDYGFRIYNPNLGRFLSVDPLTKSYPWYTPYQFAGNRPIDAIDLDGLEELLITRSFNKSGNNYSTHIKIVNATGPLSISYHLMYDTDTKKTPIALKSEQNLPDFKDAREKQAFTNNWDKEKLAIKTCPENLKGCDFLLLTYPISKEAPVKFMVEIDLGDVTDGKGIVTMLTIRDANGEIVLNKEYYSTDLLSSKNDFVKDITKTVGKHSSQTTIKVDVGVIEGNKALAKTIGNILQVAINPQATLDLNTRGGAGSSSGDAKPKEGELRGEGGNNAQVEINVEGGEPDNSANIPADKRGG